MEFEVPIKIKGVRTNCVDNTSKMVELNSCVIGKPGDWAFYLKGGPTGYESFCLPGLSDDFVQRFTKDNEGWCACAGTKNRWDTLIIPADEMKRLFCMLCVMPFWDIKEEVNAQGN